MYHLLLAPEPTDGGADIGDIFPARRLEQNTMKKRRTWKMIKKKTLKIKKTIPKMIKE